MACKIHILLIFESINFLKHETMNAHEIDYKIYGEEMQFVAIELDPQEAVIADPEAL